MKSKKLLSSLMALSIIGTSSLAFNDVKAETVVSSNNKAYIQSIGEYRSNSLNVVLRKQEGVNWCWAATTQAVLKNLGINVSQSDIVTYIKNSPIDDTASDSEIIDVLNHFADQSKYTSAKMGGALSFQEIKNEIDAGRPIIATIPMGNINHAIIIYGYEIQKSGSTRVMYKDPGVNSVTSGGCEYNYFCNGIKWQRSFYGVGRK